VEGEGGGLVFYNVSMNYPQIFTRYDKHRDLILDEVFASLQKLPSNKRNLRTYKWV